jgi:hypothetical protein
MLQDGKGDRVEYSSTTCLPFLGEMLTEFWRHIQGKDVVRFHFAWYEKGGGSAVRRLRIRAKAFGFVAGYANSRLTISVSCYGRMETAVIEELKRRIHRPSGPWGVLPLMASFTNYHRRDLS